jgi:hypothetical protein
MSAKLTNGIEQKEFGERISGKKCGQTSLPTHWPILGN